MELDKRDAEKKKRKKEKKRRVALTRDGNMPGMIGVIDIILCIYGS